MLKIHAVFVGKPTEVDYNGKKVLTGIYKNEVKGVVIVNKLNLEGDQQADLKVHGGVNKAVYVYPSEYYDYWKTSRPDLTFEAGIFGENLSSAGLDDALVCVGDEFQIGSVVFRVTNPRMPCFKLGIKMNDVKFVKEFLEAQKTGFYFKVLQEGKLQAGDTITQVNSDGHGLTIQEVVRIYHSEKTNKELLEKAVNSPNLPEDWRDFYRKRLV